jgi:hypothetical protein
VYGSGDLDTGKIVLREYVNGTVGFPQLGLALGHSPTSLMRMLCPTGNPQAKNLFEMVAYLQKAEGTCSKFTQSQPPREVAGASNWGYETSATEIPKSSANTAVGPALVVSV